MGFTCNTVILRTPTGILKICEIIVVLICLLLARFGRDGQIFHFGTNNTHFLGVGTCVGYAIIVPAVLFTYLLGSNLTFLELFINIIGAALFIATGALTIDFHSAYRGGEKVTGIALGVLCIVAGALFLVDFLIAIKNT